MKFIPRQDLHHRLVASGAWPLMMEWAPLTESKDSEEHISHVSNKCHSGVPNPGQRHSGTPCLVQGLTGSLSTPAAQE